MDFHYGWGPHVSAAERRRKAAIEVEKRRKRGESITPIVIEGRKIANTFWGKSWCENLERYSDYANRLPRGRTYARNGSVIHLEVNQGSIEALVSGSALYKVKLKIAAVGPKRWKSICTDCAGAIDSLVELLQGRFSKGVMERICRQDQGLFPSPTEIDLSCSCPDGAWMCKHVAAALYGVGARLDRQPELLFLLRGVDEKELIANAGEGLRLSKSAPVAGRVLDAEDLSGMFGLDMAPGGEIDAPPAKSRGRAVKAVAKKAVKKKSIATQAARKPAKTSARTNKKIRAIK
ncbi:MAG TPA: SWIM zinc finger family protein [Bryobacteraceae bacterium]|nr:SWIM zinc finger family protein [Bryobacteraceae bacterium]